MKLSKGCTAHMGAERELYGCTDPEPLCRCGSPLIPVHDCDNPVDVSTFDDPRPKHVCGCREPETVLIVVDQDVYEQISALIDTYGVDRIKQLIDVIAESSFPNG